MQKSFGDFQEGVAQYGQYKQRGHLGSRWGINKPVRSPLWIQQSSHRTLIKGRWTRGKA
jgi:hypothetical protein